MDAVAGIAIQVVLVCGKKDGSESKNKSPFGFLCMNKLVNNRWRWSFDRCGKNRRRGRKTNALGSDGINLDQKQNIPFGDLINDIGQPASRTL